MYKSKTSSTITIRLDNVDIDRLKIRALNKHVTINQYVKWFILKDLHRNKKNEDNRNGNLFRKNAEAIKGT